MTEKTYVGMSRILLATLMCVSLLSGCQTLYSSEVIAEMVVKEEQEPYLLKSKCSYALVHKEAKVGYFANGVCFAFKNKFIFRDVSTKNIEHGITNIFLESEIESVGVTEPNILGLRQFQFKTQKGIAAILFRPEAGVGINLDQADNFLRFYKSNGKQEIAKEKINRIEYPPHEMSGSGDIHYIYRGKFY